MTLRTLNYGNYGIFLIMGHAGFCPSAVVSRVINTSKGVIPMIKQVGVQYSYHMPKFPATTTHDP